VPLRGVRRAIAHTLTRAWLEVPRIIDYREIDATALLRARASLRQRAIARGDQPLGQALTPTPLVVRAAVLAARDHPYVNASIDLEREEITLHRHYHVGIATAGPDGLTVPVVHDADHLSLAEIALEIVALSRAARERRLRPDQLAGPTFTVNNFGSLGTWMGTPIVRPPEVVNLGVGAIRDRVVAVDGAPRRAPDPRALRGGRPSRARRRHSGGLRQPGRRSARGPGPPLRGPALMVVGEFADSVDLLVLGGGPGGYARRHPRGAARARGDARRARGPGGTGRGLPAGRLHPQQGPDRAGRRGAAHP
jgi:hypothetical protein